jgi:hypothetical protein
VYEDEVLVRTIFRFGICVNAVANAIRDATPPFVSKAVQSASQETPATASQAELRHECRTT